MEPNSHHPILFVEIVVGRTMFVVRKREIVIVVVVMGHMEQECPIRIAARENRISVATFSSNMGRDSLNDFTLSQKFEASLDADIGMLRTLFLWCVWFIWFEALFLL